MTNKRALELISDMIKHLPGEHDQESHAGGRGAGTSNVGASKEPEVPDTRPQSAYDKDLIRATSEAKKKGIKPTKDRAKVQERAREASDVVNQERMKPTGYTVYSSDAPAYDLDAKGNMVDGGGSFPMVAYGSGETPSKVRQMRRILEDNGYQTAMGPENYGIIVGNRAWRD